MILPASRQTLRAATATLKEATFNRSKVLNPHKKGDPVPARRQARKPLRGEPNSAKINERPLGGFEGAVDGHSEERPLRLLTFNIQVGIKTDRYRQYVTRGWKHVLPHTARHENLRLIAEVVQQYDLVALQEIDSGSIRSGFLNQVEYLAEEADFPFWYTQTNRDLGVLAQHGNGMLLRMRPQGLEDHKLPGRIPGRGAIIVRLPYAGRELVVVQLHLSLGVRSREAQLQYLARQLDGEELVVVMGDMNSHMATDVLNSPLGELGLVHPEAPHATFPAWRPQLALDHILASPTLNVTDHEVLPCHISDHLPIGVTLALAS